MKRNRGDLLFGLLVLAIGIVLLTNSLGFTRVSVLALLFRYWPVFIIVGGVGLLLNHRNRGEVISGILVSILGIALLLRNVGYIHFDLSILFKLFWPVLLILVGLIILTGRHSNGKSNIALMGGVERTKMPWALDETAFYAVMGGIELDFSLAEIPEGTTVIDLIAVMGGIEIKVSKNIELECDGFALLGGVEMLDKSAGGIISSASTSYTPSEPTTKKLIFHCRAVMGGIEIKASS